MCRLLPDTADLASYTAEKLEASPKLNVGLCVFPQMSGSADSVFDGGAKENNEL